MGLSLKGITFKGLVKSFVISDLPPVPGPSTLSGGNLTQGYYGLVPATEFITGPALSTAVNYTTGTAFNSTAPWMKFSYNSKTLFISQKPFRYNVSYSSLVAAGIMYGETIITVLGRQYKVRCMTGAVSDPAPITSAGSGGE